jgi:hypothetical protein
VDVFHFCLLDTTCKNVTGARLDLDLEATEFLLTWFQEDERIKHIDDMSIPCQIRDQLEAILETQKRLEP